MNSLTAEQIQQLVKIIIEEHGDDLKQAEFTDALLGLLEGIAGFETASQQTINNLIHQLWSKYHE